MCVCVCIYCVCATLECKQADVLLVVPVLRFFSHSAFALPAYYAMVTEAELSFPLQ